MLNIYSHCKSVVVCHWGTCSFIWMQEKHFYDLGSDWVMIVFYCGYVKYSTHGAHRRKVWHDVMVLPECVNLVLGLAQLENIQIFIFSQILFYWSIVDLQCCVNFCCSAKWFSFIYIFIYIYVYTYIYKHIAFHILFHCGLSQNV